MPTSILNTHINAWLSSTEREVRRGDGGTTALLRSRFDASLEALWAACSVRDQLRNWFADVSGELKAGAKLTFDVGAPHKLTSDLLRCEPFKMLLFTWLYPGREVDEIELRLSRDGGGTLVHLEHRSKDRTDWWLGAGSGWEYALIRLRVFLQGDDPSNISAEELDQKLGPLWKAAVP
jgi:uncharacterized protein YndB with AHSA1/START domain